MTQVNQLRVIPDSETFSAQTKHLGGKKVEVVFVFAGMPKAPDTKNEHCSILVSCLRRSW